MEDILKFKLINKLKEVTRANSVKQRKESTAEHVYSCMLLANYFLDLIDQDLDKVKVYEMLMFHDLVEIEVGDIPINKKHNPRLKQNQELQAAQILQNKLPKQQGQKFYSSFLEFEELQTSEAKFVKAIDALDPIIHEMDYKEDWKGWTKEFLIEKKEKYFEPFPKLKEIFHELLNCLEKEGYFNQ